MSQEDKRVWSLIFILVLALVLLIPVSSWLFGIQYDYTLSIVASGGAFLGLLTGVLGCFAVLRQESLIGDTLSHAALPGVGFAFLFFGRELGFLLLGAGIAGWLGVQFIAAVTQTTRIKQDTAMAIALVSFFALGIALLSYIQGRGDASQAGLDSFIFGQAAAIRLSDIQLISGLGSASFLILFAFWKEFKLITFNREFAIANGFNVRFLDALLSLLIVLAIVSGLQVAGVILMVGILIAPAVAARQWTHKLEQMLVLAGVFGAFSGAVGAIISGVDVGLPTGPLIIVVASLLVLISLFFAPQRGLLWTWLRQETDKRRFATSYILRDLYSHALQHDNPSEPMLEQTLIKVRGAMAKIGLHELSKVAWIERNNGAWYLSEKGIAAAKADLRNQQLWQVYRRYSQSMDLPIIPEDRESPIDELLPDEVLKRLEKRLEGVPSEWQS